MARSDHHDPAPEDETAALIGDELVKLRRGEGISHARVKDLAPSIQKLRVVDSEMQRDAQLSRSVAAYNVIRCAARRSLVNHDFRRILVRTLNVDGLGRPSLTDRRHDLMTELRIKVMNNYIRIESEAYLELVALLLGATESPCRVDPRLDPVPDLDDVRLSLSRRRGETISLEIPAEPLVEVLLQWLANNRDSPQAHRHVISLVELLPKLRPYAPGGRLPAARDERTFISDLVRRLANGESSLFNGVDALVPEAAVELFTSRPGVPEQSVASSNRPSLVESVRRKRTGQHDQVRPEYFTVRANTIALLASVIDRFERTDTWHELYNAGEPVRQRS
jgi:hypothetical protein